MCGIAAIFNYRTGLPVSPGELTAIRDAMLTRGPDGSGNWISPDHRVGLGHRRLSIIDLSSAGAQPMQNHDGSLVITFNGEIYNYRELRAQLESKGRRFASQTDTEVLLHLYELEGPAMLDKLRGMFTFAIWDARKKGLFLARDPFGIKPLYYADDGKTLRVASQVKALLAGGHIDTAPDSAGHVGFFLWGHVPSPFTLYRGISNLPAGHWMWIAQDEAPELHPWCDIASILSETEKLKHRNTETLKYGSPLSPLLSSALRDSVRHHLVADVPVGVFLSSGLDSTTIAALAAQSSATLRTVTLGFEEFRGTVNNEVPLAEQVAAQYGAQHQTIWVTRNDFRENFATLMQAMDQPTCDGINSFFISLAAAKAGLKVALSGLGGDELFAGYPSFRDIPRSVRTFGALPFAPSVGRAFRIISSPLIARLTSPKYAGLFEYGGTYAGAYLLRRGMFMPWELPDLLDPDLVREGWDRLQPLTHLAATTKDLESPRLRVSALEMTWYMRQQLLRDTDWASMRHSLEVRTPLVDLQLLKNLAPLLASAHPPSKRDMGECVAQKLEDGRSKFGKNSGHLSPNSELRTSGGLPPSVLDRRKTGFVTPVRDWLLSDPQLFNVSAFQRFGKDRGLRGWTRLVYAEYWKSGESSGQSVETRSRQGSRSSLRPLTSTLRAAPISAFQDFSVSAFPRKILVFRIGQLGDTIAALPAMWAIRDHFKHAELTLLCDRHPKKGYVFGPDLLRGSGLFDHFDFYPVRADSAFQRLNVSTFQRSADMLHLLSRLKREKFDTLVYLSPSARSRRQINRDLRFFRLAGIKNFIGTGGFATPPIPISGEPLAPSPSETDLLLARLSASGLTIPAPGHGCMDLRLGPAEQSEFQTWLTNQTTGPGKPVEVSGPLSRGPSAGISALSFVAFAPGSKMPAKRWPLDRFAQVGQALIDKFDIWPIVFGGAEDAADAQRLLDAWGRGHNAAGQLSLRASAYGLKQCLLYVGNDTGTMHLAASVGTRCVAVFSARDFPGRWNPYGTGHRALRAAIDCEGCGLVECLDLKNECLNRITVPQVLEACEAALREAPGPVVRVEV